MNRRGILLGGLLAATLVIAGGLPSTSGAAGNKYLVTYVARSCPSYSAISANLARNNIQESLEDLGPDTAYHSGQAIDPTIEANAQPQCQPITNWRFTLGTGYKSHASVGPWGSLSAVTTPYSTQIQTLASTPLLSVTGAPTGKNLAGAVTVQLTDQQADRAAASSRLWAQGGLPTDPVMNAAFPSTYGFGALRCAIDNLNGDNVEWISFPTGTTHVFCYAYYVVPPPTAGRIVVRKQVTGVDAYSNQFNFHGNISYEPGGNFSINAGPGADGQAEFYRAATTGPDTEWSFAESAQPNWSLDSLSCSSQTQGSDWIADQATATGTVFLAAGDTVTCTYVDRFVPPPAGLEITKTTFGGIGTFKFPVSQNGNVVGRPSAQTTAPGQPVTAAPHLNLSAGRYKIEEQSPSSSSGRWQTVSVYCNGTRLKPDHVLVDLVSGHGTVCDYTNAFIPAGSLTLQKTTLGSFGTTGFVITNAKNEALQLKQSATTTHAGETAVATGDKSDHLPLGEYVIQETSPSDRVDGKWDLIYVRCDDEVFPFEQGRVTITLTRNDPHRTCTFVNSFEPGGSVTPEGGGTNPDANLKVTKSAVTPTVHLGGTLVYRVRVTNVTDNDAHDVYATEQRIKRASFLSVSPSRYTCVRVPSPSCRIGTLKAHRSVTLTVRVFAVRTGTFRNVASIGTSTDETSVRDNVAAASVRVIAPRSHFPGGLG